MKYKVAKNNIVVACVRLPTDLYEAIMQRVSMHEEDLDFSKFVRRAIRREMKNSGFSPTNNHGMKEEAGV
jgi:hypothetical protein